MYRKFKNRGQIHSWLYVFRILDKLFKRHKHRSHQDTNSIKVMGENIGQDKDIRQKSGVSLQCTHIAQHVSTKPTLLLRLVDHLASWNHSKWVIKKGFNEKMFANV